MRLINFLPLVFVFSFCFGQDSKHKFNLNFEKVSEGEELPNDWFQWGYYALSKDSATVFNGKYSAKINSTSGNSFGSIAYEIPSNYKGKNIALEGYMKLENVSNGHAGLLLRLDGESSTLQFDNMQSQGLTGTSGWKKYKISLPYDAKTKSIFVAGILSGSGIAWFDDFKVTIDGRDIQGLKEVEKIRTKGELDDEFDANSKAVFKNLTNKKIQDLVVLGRIWGFLKYHHPAIATGNYNWDFELFRILPDYLKASTPKIRNTLLFNWIKSYGEVKACKSCKPVNQKAYLKPNFNWFAEYGLSKELSKQLIHIQQNRFQGHHYYIDFSKNAENPIFQNERSYSTLPFPDAGFRLLTLFRFWNMIEYYFPYKHLTDTEWEDVLENFITPFLTAENELAYELTTVKLISMINDTHANLWGGDNAIQEWKGKFYAPFHVRFREDKAVVTDYYNPELQPLAKIKIGDIILSINGKPVSQIIEEWSAYYPASNQPTRLRDIGENLLRSKDSSVMITFETEGVIQNQQLKLYKKDHLNHYRWYKPAGNEKSYHWLEGNVGYITLKNIKEKDIKAIKKEFIHAKAIVIDIRNYPSYFVPFALGQFFIDKFTPFAKFTVANDKTPGEFLLNDGVKIPPKGKQFTGKLIVLVNELSQSQAEYTAMAFRSTPNCTIIGSTTAGADGNVSKINLPGGMSTMISGIGVHYPDGSETQRIGIVPDIEIKPTIKGIKEGRDEVLEKALELINAH